LAAFDCDAYEHFCHQLDVKSFPTVTWFSSEHKDGLPYPGKRTTNAVVDYVKAKIGVRDKDPDWKTNRFEVIFLDGNTFETFKSKQTKANGSDGFLLYLWVPDHIESVKFQPSVAQLSQYTKDFFPIATMNCARYKDICDEHFGGYPGTGKAAGVFQLFLDGEKSVEYDGKMATEELIYFILDKIGMTKEEFLQDHTSFQGKGMTKKVPSTKKKEL